ncbi:hypothetical protein PCE1_001129 [Barthelona sp. PCE]
MDYLDTLKDQQDELAESIGVLAKELKGNAIIIQDLLMKESSVLKEVSEATRQNIGKTEDEEKNLRELNDSVFRRMFSQSGLFVMGCVIFFVTILFIRICPRPRR